MKEIQPCKLKTFYGGNANSNWEGRGNTGSHSKNKGGVYGAVDSCGVGIFGGLVAGSPGGPMGMAAGVISGMIAGQCKVSNFGRGNGSAHNSNSSSERSFGGQCTW